jgi:hypothetical protein
MNNGQLLSKLIQDKIERVRPFFAYAIEQNEDYTWQVQPVDNQPIIYNAQTFQELEDGNQPEIGSLVLCIYIDQFSCFITEIISYDRYFINSSNSVGLFGKKETVVSSDIVNIFALDGTPEIVREIIDQDFADVKGINLQTFDDEHIISLATTKKNSDISIRTLETDSDILLTAKNGAVLISAKEQSSDILVSDDISVRSNNTVALDGSSVLITSNNVTLNEILTDLSTTLNTLLGAAGTFVPPLPLVPNLIAKITAYNS